MSPKNVKKLVEKKYREETGLFMVEGEKNIEELLASDLSIVELFGTKEFLAISDRAILEYQNRTKNTVSVDTVKESGLLAMGTFQSNQAGIAVATQKPKTPIGTILENAATNIVLMLDDVRDPGNLGTLIRLADWYGIAHIVASETTCDVYNPKVITASMGSFTRINVSYFPLEELLKDVQDRRVIVADMLGENIHTTKPPQNGFLIMGSESHGVHDDLKKFATHTVTIPRFGKAESLNVAVATGILLDAIKRG